MSFDPTQPFEVESAPARGFDPSQPFEVEPAAVEAGRGLMEIPRQVGLAGRYAVEGVAQAADLLAEPIRNFVVNPIVKLMGGTPITSQYEAAGRVADAVGLPSPENANERVVADASRLVAGAGGLAGAAAGLAPLATGRGAALLGSLAANPGAQATGAAGAGLAGGSVREAGGGPLAQGAAAVAGGVAAPLVAGKAVSAGQSVQSLVRRALGTKNIAATLEVELQRVGVDWNSLSSATKTALVNDARKAVYRGQPLDPAALRRLADFRNVGATPLVGDLTQNPRTLTMERNLAKQMANTGQPLGGPDLPGLQNENARKVIGALEDVADSPLDTYATGDALRTKVRGTDAAMQAEERVLYSQARDSAGRSIPLDREGFVNQAFDNLAKSNKGAFLPAEIESLLNQISAGQVTKGKQVFDVPFDVNTIDQLKTILATASRGSRDGNTRAAIAAVRGALEDVKPVPIRPATGSQVPLAGATGARLAQADAAAARMAPESLAAFDKARAFARSRREWQESAKFIEDALDGATPDKFVQTHIIGAPVEELAKVQRFVQNDATLRNGIRKQLVEHIMARGKVDSDVVKFSSAGMADALRQIGERKLRMFFSKAEIGKIKSAINVGRYIQSQPIGSAVNNSNTAAMIWGRLSDILLKGKALPVVGPLLAEPARGLTLNLQAKRSADLTNALVPGAPRQPLPASPLLLAAGVPSRDQ